MKKEAGVGPFLKKKKKKSNAIAIICKEQAIGIPSEQ